jgi:hypothetical protein
MQMGHMGPSTGRDTSRGWSGGPGWRGQSLEDAASERQRPVAYIEGTRRRLCRQRDSFGELHIRGAAACAVSARAIRTVTVIIVNYVCLAALDA